MCSSEHHIRPGLISHSLARVLITALVITTGLVIIAVGTASAQDHSGRSDSAQRITVGAQAIGMIMRQAPALAGRTFTEGYLTQPTLMAHAAVWPDAVTLHVMLSLEGWTLERGELNPGMIGEGYIDRRHPHTYLHELTTTAEHRVGAARASLTVGKGFAPFGTDDPMVRPFVRYPVNHHLAQILERIIAIAGVSAGPLSLEAGVFNGDEPESSGDAPNRDRWWDSWSTRGTLAPGAGTEIQLSYARVRSPENATGGGPDDQKWSASARYHRIQQRRYALAEWARTTHYVGSSPTFDFSSFLVEAQSGVASLLVAGRFEVTERPDEERLADPFRTLLGGHDFSILGRSRWTIATIRVASHFSVRSRVEVVPFAELAHHRVRATLRPSGFDPTQFYGADRIWTLAAGARLAFGALHRRVGRYGAAVSSQQDISTPPNAFPPHAH